MILYVDNKYSFIENFSSFQNLFSCPVDEISEIIDPMANVNEEVYFSKFKTFRFGNQSTVFAHCTVQVCLISAECEQVFIYCA